MEILEPTWDKLIATVNDLVKRVKHLELVIKSHNECDVLQRFADENKISPALESPNK